MKPPVANPQPPVISDEVKRRRRNTTRNALLITATVLLVTFIFWSIGMPTKPTNGINRAKCLSNLKQIGTAVSLYTSDNDDLLPPVYVFSETQNQASIEFRNTLGKYLKQESLVCPADKQANNESDFGYVHCKTLIGLIPDYSKGSRVLNLDKDVPDLATTSYLRDPVRRNGNWKPAGMESVPEKNVLYSPHGAAFVILYLDAHVKASTPIDLMKQL